MGFSRLSSILLAGVVLHGCGKIDQKLIGVEGIVKHNGVKVFNIVTQGGHIVCIKGVQNFDPNTDKIGQHPNNEDLYEAIEALGKLDPNKKTSITTGGSGNSYFIVTQDGVEVLKLYTKEGRNFSANPINSSNELRKVIDSCTHTNI